MNFLELKTRVKTYSGKNDLTVCGYAVNDALNMIYNALKWPFLKIPSTITLTAGLQYYALPSNFKYPNTFWYRNTTVGYPNYLNPVNRVLDEVNDGTPIRYKVMKRSAPTGSPITKTGWYVYFEPIPSAAYVAQYPTMYYDYFYKPSDLSDDSDTPQLDEADHQVVVWGAVTLLTGQQGDATGFQSFVNMWQEGYKDIIQRAIDFYGEGVIVSPGSEITEYSGGRITDYGMPL